MPTTIHAESGTVRTNADAPDRIEKRVTLRAPRSKVWRALTQIDEFCRWFGLEKADGEFAPGARVRMIPADKSCGDEFHVFVEQMDPERLFSWRWHPGAPDPNADYYAEPTTLVVFELKEVAGGTLLTIVESGFNRISLTRRAKVLGENDGGWDEQLVSLERYVGQAS
jgi:uncharacterized protein YndB with AHSA1/START domain